jgi:hypothetical protein
VAADPAGDGFVALPPVPVTPPIPPAPVQVPAPVPPASQATASITAVNVKGQQVSVSLACKGTTGQNCSASLELVVKETLRGAKVVAVSAAATHKSV